ncbi:hypothetical protein GGS21DRAFT_172783 [Xylaria nigripes]|nr:hypothetical protein GGS21DRAFT_172783 [Xylaria nigripes]
MEGSQDQPPSMSASQPNPDPGEQFGLYFFDEGSSFLQDPQFDPNQVFPLNETEPVPQWEPQTEPAEQLAQASASASASASAPAPAPAPAPAQAQAKAPAPARIEDPARQLMPPPLGPVPPTPIINLAMSVRGAFGKESPLYDWIISGEKSYPTDPTQTTLVNAICKILMDKEANKSFNWGLVPNGEGFVRIDMSMWIGEKMAPKNWDRLRIPGGWHKENRVVEHIGHPRLCDPCVRERILQRRQSETSKPETGASGTQPELRLDKGESARRGREEDFEFDDERPSKKTRPEPTRGRGRGRGATARGQLPSSGRGSRGGRGGRPRKTALSEPTPQEMPAYPPIPQDLSAFASGSPQTFTNYPIPETQTFTNYPPPEPQMFGNFPVAQPQEFTDFPIAQSQDFSFPMAQSQDFGFPMAQSQDFSFPLAQQQDFSNYPLFPQTFSSSQLVPPGQGVMLDPITAPQYPQIDESENTIDPAFLEKKDTR